MILYAVLAIIVVLLFVVLWRRYQEHHEILPEPYNNCLDENIQFSVYRPGTIVPERWYPMLVFAHLSECRAGQDEPDPLEEVARQAQQVLGVQSRDFQRLTQDSAGAVPREGEITFVPAANGIEFNPSCRTFKWFEDVHREEFRLRAPMAKNGETLRGSVAVFLGSILLAEITLTIHVDSSHGASVATSSLEPTHARPYRKIFASYSHKDLAIVGQFQHYARAIGDQYLRDMTDLRSGEVWNERLARMIEQADVFQLFWSSNSMRSPFVKQEWQHALSLNRSQFVRPTYWEVPLPEASEEGLPPDELKRLHFQRIAVAQSMDEKFEPGVPGALKRAMRSRVGHALSIIIPFLLYPIFLLSGGSTKGQMLIVFTTDSFLLDKMLVALKMIPSMTSGFCLIAMLAVWWARMSNKLWAALLRRGRGFWFFATLIFPLLFIIPQALRFAFALSVRDDAAQILSIILPLYLIWWTAPVLSLWIAYAWIRWMFLPYFLKDNGGEAFTAKQDNRQ